jgi:uncharacterized FAD-dependent dehydrogenase
MSELVEILLQPEHASDDAEIRKALKQIGANTAAGYRVIKRSIDARKKTVVMRLRIEIGPENTTLKSFQLRPQNVANAQEVFIAGAGPCGLFAAIRLIENGLKPIILERGKDVRSRRRDLAALNREHIVNPESNYCFGEGGAGTYSDGKLYTRSKKRGSVEEILQYLVAFGAPEDILVDAHPHIGTNKLPVLIEAMRHHIIECGGEVRFGAKLTDIRIESGKLKEIEINGNERTPCTALLLATGHSARDIFELLHRRNVIIEAKPFALGVRVEHPQEIIDRIQYHCEDRGPYLPAASYSLVHQVNDRGVYSFCMCPGGIIAPCATAPGEIVTNGWSPSKRNNPFANSGMVVSISAQDYDPKGNGNPLAALAYQQQVETAAFRLGGGGQTAPAQRLVDFTNRKVSNDLPKCSYQPGLQSAELRECLPEVVSSRLSEALKVFGNKMRGYYTNEAVLVATESRTSSPVRIPRDETLQHPQVKGLYPAGEGAGYAGGIVSAAMDGQRAANAIHETIAYGNA